MRKLVLAAAVLLAVGVAAAVAVPPLLASAEGEPAGTSAPDPSATPVISATPIPEPAPRDAWQGDMSVEHEMEIGAREGPISIALTEVQEAYPDDYAYGYITDDGFGVGFKFTAPAPALATLDAVGGPYELHENVGFNEADLQPQVGRVMDIVQEAVPKGQTFSVYPNPFTVTVEVQLSTESDGAADYAAPEGAALAALLDDLRAELYPGFDVEITSTAGRMVAE